MTRVLEHDPGIDRSDGIALDVCVCTEGDEVGYEQQATQHTWDSSSRLKD